MRTALMAVASDPGAFQLWSDATRPAMEPMLVPSVPLSSVTNPYGMSCTHRYSVPARFTPRSWTVRPCSSTRCRPDTRMARAPVGDRMVVVGLGRCPALAVVSGPEVERFAADVVGADP